MKLIPNEKIPLSRLRSRFLIIIVQTYGWWTGGCIIVLSEYRTKIAVADDAIDWHTTNALPLYDLW